MGTIHAATTLFFITWRQNVSSVSIDLPCAGRELLQPILQHLINYVQSRWFTHSRTQEGATRITTKLWIWYWTSLLTDLLLYPLETTISQLITQGLPMLVDDVEDGTVSSTCPPAVTASSDISNIPGAPTV